MSGRYDDDDAPEPTPIASWEEEAVDAETVYSPTWMPTKEQYESYRKLDLVHAIRNIVMVSRGEIPYSIPGTRKDAHTMAVEDRYRGSYVSYSVKLPREPGPSCFLHMLTTYGRAVAICKEQ